MLVIRKLLQDYSALLGLVIIAFAVVVAILAPYLAPHPLDAFQSHLAVRLRPPSAEFPFGTDNLGRDVFSRVILGTRGSLEVAVLVVIPAMLLGVPLGLIGGYYEGWMAGFIMRITDVFLAVPQLVLALVLAQLMSPSLESAMIALALTYWPFFTRTVFSETRRLKTLLFVDALRCIGVSSWRIMFLHILPNTASPIIVRATVGMGFTILTAAVLGFLGMGATPPAPDWGLTVSESRHYLPQAWGFAAFPGLAILAVVLGFNLLGDGVRDVIDPRLRRSR